VDAELLGGRLKVDASVAHGASVEEAINVCSTRLNSRTAVVAPLPGSGPS
jgi:hypothetical protein